jgi:hypothetical protein
MSSNRLEQKNEESTAKIALKIIEEKTQPVKQGPSVQNSLMTEKISKSNPESLLLNLPPDDAMYNLGFYCDAASLHNLTITCKKGRAFFQNPLDKIGLEKLLQFVAYGNKGEVKKILDANPKLLLQKEITEDYSYGLDEKNHRKIKGTALQIAFACKDVGIQKDEEGMVEMIMDYMKQLPGGDKLIKEQIAAQFPEGWLDKKKQREEMDSSELNKIIQAIHEAKEMDDLDRLKEECKEALNKFRIYLEPKQPIEMGCCFNEQLLIEAGNLYTEYYERFGNRWDSAKNLLFWQMIVSYIKRFVPSCLAMALCQNIEFLFENNKNLERSLRFYYQPSVSFYPLYPFDNDPQFSDAPDQWRALMPGAHVRQGATLACQIEKLCQVKTLKIQQIIQQSLASTQKYSCLMM